MAAARLAPPERRRDAATIYALADPRTGAVRYVGKTSRTLRDRMKAHRYGARTRPTTHVLCWLRGLFDAGLEPVVSVLENVPRGQDWVEAEQRWIAEFRARGADLCNLTEGGEGPTGYQPSPETRALISAAARGRVISELHRQRISAGLTGRVLPAEHRANVSAATRLAMADPALKARLTAQKIGRKHSAETNAKRAAAVKAAYARPEVREKHRAKLLGKRHTAETKAKMRAARLANPTGAMCVPPSERPNARAVVVDGIRYATVTAAAVALGLTQPAISQRLRRGRGAAFAD